MKSEDDVVIEPERRTPVARDVDVLVAGAGPAGIAAGIAAAREGARTLVLERFGYAGGMITGARVVAILGVGDGYRPKARGITAEIRDRLEPLGGITKPNPSGDYRVDAELFKWQAAELLEESGAEVLFHTLACDPIVEQGRVQGVITESKSGRQAFRARVVVDCTADADLAHRAGVPSENETHDVTLVLTVEGVAPDRVAAFEKEHPEQFKAITAEAQRLNGGGMPDRPRYLKDVDIADAEALSRAEATVRRDLFRSLHHLRANLPGWEQARVRETWPQLGVRQGRRIEGVARLTDADIRASRHFDDSIARLGSYLKVYKLYDPAGLDYDVPYGCLLPRTVEGLLVAGRCVSCDYLAGNTLRLIVPCFATGQAAGVAAAIAAAAGIEPRAVPIPELRARLAAQGVYLGGPDAANRPDPSATPVQVQDE